MIITKTPFRISFFGGITDHKEWSDENGGAVLNTTIDKYCYIMLRYLPQFFNYKHRIRYRLTERKNKISQINHPTVKACMEFMNIDKGIEMVHTADLPARSGIGSSSAFTVGFLNSLHALQGHKITKKQLALEAIALEQKIENIGAQDQTSAAFGGFNKITFDKRNIITVKEVIVKEEKLKLLNDHLLLFFTGFSRTSSEIVGKYIKKIHSSTMLHEMQSMVDEGVKILNGDNILEFGELLHDSWMIKKSISKVISTEAIDDIYDVARSHGVIGGKICGAGGGGFILFFAAPEKHEHIKKIFNNLVHVPFNFENKGSEIVVYNA